MPSLPSLRQFSARWGCAVNMKCAAPSWGRASVDCFVAVKADEPRRQHLQWQPRPRQVRRKKKPSHQNAQGGVLVCITNKGRLGSLHGCSGVICSVSFSSVVWFELVWFFPFQFVWHSVRVFFSFLYMLQHSVINSVCVCRMGSRFSQKQFLRRFQECPDM